MKIYYHDEDGKYGEDTIADRAYFRTEKECVADLERCITRNNGKSFEADPQIIGIETIPVTADNIYRLVIGSGGYVRERSTKKVKLSPRVYALIVEAR